MEQFPALRIPQAEPVLQASLRLLGFVSPGFVPMSLHQPDWSQLSANAPWP